MDLYFGMRFWILRWTKLVSWRPWPASWPYWFKPIKRITSTNGFFLATRSFTFAIVKCFRIICGCMNPWTMWMWQCENFLIPSLISVAMKEVCLTATTDQILGYNFVNLKHSSDTSLMLQKRQLRLWLDDSIGNNPCLYDSQDFFSLQ